jgi:superfamily II DNA or RNA helicase
MNRLNIISFFQKQAEALLKKHAVCEISFSRGTYQAEVIEKGSSYFPFFQLSDEGDLSDSFCTCETSEKGEGCPHLAAALLQVFKGGEPLHVRFRQSLWYGLTEMAARRHGYETSALQKKGKGSYFCNSKTKKKLFALVASTEAAKTRIEHLVARRIVETEETSLKFSNLSPEELANWRAGKPGPELLYELSFWSDLAKWLQSLADEGKVYKITFEGEPLPQEISIQFSQVKLSFYISQANWPSLIPALATVKSPLQVKTGHLDQQIHYDPAAQALVVVHKESSPETLEEKEGVPVGEWLYIAKRGFFHRQEDPLLGSARFEKQEIAGLLNRSAKTIQAWLDVPLHLEPVEARYRLQFDAQQRLHIEMYVFAEGDLKQQEAACFIPWVYLPDTGFWKLQDLLFSEREKIIPKERVSDFVGRHRHWLHKFRGFQTHLGTLEAHLTFCFTAQGELRFDAKLDFPEQIEEAIDFDEWIYLKGEGFYMKRQSGGRLPLHPGLTIPQEEISKFLVSHKEDLEQVRGFFAARLPIAKSGLSLQVTAEEQIAVVPHYEAIPEIPLEKIQFFGDFVYVAGEGFSELPPAMRLPERFRKKTVLTQQQETSFLTYEFESLKPLFLSIDPRISRPKELLFQVASIQREGKRGGAEWLVDAHYSSEIGRVDFFSLYDAIQEKKNIFFSPAGLLSLKDARFSWIRQLPKGRLDRKKKLLRLTTLEWLRLASFESISPPKGEQAEESKSLLEELGNFEPAAMPNISHLKSSLRRYQELGVQWLWFLYCHGLSGLLCDDMGLGKTHQAMALLAGVMHEDPGSSHKYLVVCPTSVIYHWQQLLARFLPALRVHTYYGLTRTLDRFQEDYDLLLTSYGILRMGDEALATLYFEVAIFDEIQIAKNHASQTHKALRRIPSQMRIGLTGTPIENRLRELKSLLDLVLPGYLPIDSVFRELFIIPIEKHQDAEKKQLLTKLAKPFLLRRKKSEVLTDLPEKIEEIAYCDLSEEQRSLYQETALQMRDSIYREFRDETKPISYVHIFSILSTLKQICDHPALYLGEVKNYQTHSSGKWDLFVELLTEARNSGQKVVVFSQYLDMLAIIETYLRKKNIGFATIKGATRDRAEQLRLFRDDPTCEVFTASLLAAGVGIDLTVASVVIHYDRWWNPAKENQATDRVHRIGQSRGVQVFKLVTKNTIEEHIHAIIEKKGSLMEELIGKDDADQISTLSREELMAVFEAIWKES